MTGHLVGHLVRRGVEHLTQKQAYINQLEKDAQVYEDAAPEKTLKPQELLPLLLTGIVALFVIWSIDYTIGQVMASLSIIESPSRTTIVESGPPPPYADEPDAPLEKESLLVDASAKDVEVTVIDHKPITAKITTTIAHLHRIGGFRARWRGIGLAALYHFVHNSFIHLVARFIGFGLIGESLVYIFISVGMARLHMAWTHSMITYPSTKRWWQRVPARKDCKALVLPAFVYAVAQQATIILPLGVAFALGVIGPNADHIKHAAAHHEDCSKMIGLGLRMLAVPATYAFVGLAILFPASVTLTRIEAALLPEGEEAIVPFDKSAIMGDIDLSVRGGCKALFVQAWRSFDRASRWRLVKLYVKMVFAQLTIAFIAVHLMVAELYVIGGEKIAIFAKAASAQLKLAAIEAHEAHGNN